LDSPDFAADLLRRIRQELPEQMGQLQLSALNPRLRMYRYRQGQRFAPHMDHWYQPDPRSITLHTVLVYFNEDFEGGETKFSEQLEASVVPEAGMVAIFQHKLRHEGCEVTRGVKYAMRTDTLYTASEAIELPRPHSNS
jgi:prolyl 4-hydroxylase